MSHISCEHLNRRQNSKQTRKKKRMEGSKKYRLPLTQLNPTAKDIQCAIRVQDTILRVHLQSRNTLVLHMALIDGLEYYSQK